ncbi:hypothetical protein CHARACLAT_019319, partial [Characodon lateralis]|nr:hypothetical protein [Characodon lateralis]
AVDILKQMKEKNVVLDDNNITSVFHMLSAVVAKGGISTVRRLQDTIFTLGLAKPTANLCSPVVTAYLDSNDVSGALEAALECQKLYNQLPRIHDIIVALVEKGDTDLLQKGGGPTGGWPCVSPSGLARPGPASSNPATRHSLTGPDPRPGSMVGPRLRHTG